MRSVGAAPPRSRGRFGLILGVVLGLFALAQPAVAAASPNYSIFSYKSGTIVTGTLKAGHFTQLTSISTSKHWDLGAASRTSLFLYNRTTGAAETGTFKGGIDTKKHTYTLQHGYDLATASCDTLMLYRRTDGKVTTATLVNGVLGQVLNGR